MQLHTLRLANTGTETVRLDAVEFALEGPFFTGAADCRVYKEGLTVVGVSGARGAEDCDFELDPGFLRFTVSDPVSYRWDRAGRSCAEQVAVVAREDGEALLAGFVTANRFFCRIATSLDPAGAATVTVTVDLDGLELAPGAEVGLETLMTATDRDVEALLNLYAGQLGAAMNALSGGEIPTGWCSYYYYYGQETESDILENAQFLASHGAALPVRTIQIDDGWQAARGNWLQSHPKKFPHGMEWLAARIRKLGFEPGLWVAPFLISPEAPVHASHNDWLLRDGDGTLLEMGGSHFLDPTHPGALAWLREIFTTLRGWGYSYFKLDFMMVATCHGARYHDRAVTRVEAYRRGLQAIREAVGPDVFLLGGTSLIAPNVGLVNGCRVSTDVTPFWCKAEHTPESPAIFNVCRNIINRGYMHRRLWLNDPDCLIVREHHNRPKYAHIPSLTLDETRMLASAMILSGGAIFLGDRLTTLPPARLDILGKVLALSNGTPAVPVDRMEREIPRVWFRRGDGTAGNPPLLGVFNWGDRAKTIAVPLARLGLDAARIGCCADVWRDDEPVDGAALSELSLAPHTCRLIRIVS